MEPLVRVIAVAALCLTPHWSWSDEVVCPPADKVILSATSPGWLEDTYSPRSGPRLAFEGMRFSQEMVTCRYTVEAAKLITVRRYARCSTSKGTWQEQGMARFCQAGAPEECTVVCDLPAPQK